MNKDEIKAKLNLNRSKLLLKDTRPQLNILTTIQVAKEGSNIHKERLAIVEAEDKYYLKEYTGQLPNSVHHGVLISEQEANLIKNVISDYEKYKHYHVNPYSWLVAGCLYKGLDLIEEGLLEV